MGILEGRFIMESAGSQVISYICFFLTALCFSILINALLLKFSHTLGIRNQTDTIIRWSSESKPSLGGISFFIIFLFSIISYSLIFPHGGFHNHQMIGILVAATVAFLMGLYDDAYDTSVTLKFISQFAIAIILIYTGTYIQFFESRTINYFLTIVWVIGIMNSINMLDNMDGITSIVCIFIIITTMIDMFFTGIMSHSFFLIMLGVLASLIGFLKFNWHPSKMFMGDTGSQFLGVFIAIIGIIYYWNPCESNAIICHSKRLVLVMLIFAVPLIDTATVIIKRISSGKSPFVGGKDHTTHHMSYIGLTDRQVAIVIAVICSVSMSLGLLAQHFIGQWSYIAACIFLIYFLAIFSGLFYIANLNK